MATGHKRHRYLPDKVRFSADPNGVTNAGPELWIIDGTGRRNAIAGQHVEL